MIKHSIILQARSPGTYEYIRRTRLMILPSRTTLRSYIGKSTGEVGITNAIRQRMKMERENLTAIERHVSLQIDEMAIQPKLKFIKQWDKLAGEVNMGGIIKPSKNTTLANRLLAFIVTGIGTSYKIAAAFFFVRRLTGEDLYKLTNYVMKEVENEGFSVDNCVK